MLNVQNKLRLNPMTDIKLWKQLVYFLVGLIGLVIFELILEFIIVMYGKSAYPNVYDYTMFIQSTGTDMFLNGVAYMGIFSVFVILVGNDVNEFLKSFKGWKPYVAAAIGFSSILLFNVIYSAVLDGFHIAISDNANESSLNTMVTDFPFTSLLIFAIIGPLVEEVTYRVGLFSMLKRVHVILAYAVTIVVFALIHFDFTSSTMVNELLNIPYYAFAAVTFCFLYHKFGFASSVAAHITNNVFSLLATILSVFNV